MATGIHLAGGRAAAGPVGFGFGVSSGRTDARRWSVPRSSLTLDLTRKPGECRKRKAAGSAVLFRCEHCAGPAALRCMHSSECSGHINKFSTLELE
jgi:hypothetical protein